jgi:UDP-N-acetylmuramate dehydrogenase
MAAHSHAAPRWHRMDSSEHSVLKAAFGPLLKENESLAKYTSARLGGPAEFFAIAESAGELAEMVRAAWRIKIRPFILGGGSNVIISDNGVRGLVILNRARALEIHDGDEPPWRAWKAA